MTRRKPIIYGRKCLQRWLPSVAIAVLSLQSIAGELPESLRIVKSIVSERGMSLAMEVVDRKYPSDSTITIKYELKNNRSESIYLIMPETASPGYSSSPQRLVLSLERVIFDDHYFESPRLLRLKPGRTFKAESPMPLKFLKANFKPGQWFLSFSMGYLDEKAMREFKKLQAERSPGKIVKSFQQLQQVLVAGPIEITLIGH